MQSAKILKVSCYVVLMLLFFGCEGRKSSAFNYPKHDEPKVLFSGKLVSKPLETVGGALPLWRDFGDVKPTLVWLSNKTLSPVPREVQGEVSKLLANENVELIRKVTAMPFEPATLLRADMAVAAAIHEKYFSRVVWVVPVAKNRELKLEPFVQQLRERAEMWGEYIDTFKLDNGHISGMLDGVPIDVVTIEQLPTISDPILLHIDTGYFQPIYTGEIKTPLYPLLHQLGKTLAQHKYKVWSVTLSYDTLSDGLGLETRFIADELARYLANPEMLEQETKGEALRSDALYLANFFQTENIFKDYHELKNLNPVDASAWFGEYQALRDLRQQANALKSLAQAVSLDPIYGYEYQSLADQALQANRQDKALEMLDNATKANPSDPFIRLQKGRLLLAIGQEAEAKKILQELSQLPWSPVYYPNVKAEIERLY